jgi:hypothetical protein
MRVTSLNISHTGVFTAGLIPTEGINDIFVRSGPRIEIIRDYRLLHPFVQKFQRFHPMLFILQSNYHPDAKGKEESHYHHKTTECDQTLSQ